MLTLEYTLLAVMGQQVNVTATTEASIEKEFKFGIKVVGRWGLNCFEVEEVILPQRDEFAITDEEKKYRNFFINRRFRIA